MTISGAGLTLTDYIGEVRYQISPLSFYPGESGADGEALRNSPGICRTDRTKRRYWDLILRDRYHFPLSGPEGKTRSMAWKLFPQAIEDAKQKCSNQMAIHNAEFYVGKAEEVLPENI